MIPVIFVAGLIAAGGLVWWLNVRNAREIEHNQITGTGGAPWNR
ncbi:hypothetical protein PP512_gp60 [Gordonia phage Denise]|uniref:Uncharacterized protein n=1 Tax=Gordonia phage Denise TaxID=2652879 RepID=A0A5P8DCG8_9CAUD|nr:hypothetical protein PP512_gp60 [Gordonia phage Denise]QFP96675.1 hypothetical protein SEA_DENISE_60 [Gordonia phage Denise]